MDIYSVTRDIWLIFIAWNITIPGCILFLSFGGFYASGSSETLVEISKHKYIVQTTIQVAFVIHFCFSCQFHRTTSFVPFFVFMLNKALSMSMSTSYHLLIYVTVTEILKQISPNVLSSDDEV